MKVVNKLVKGIALCAALVAIGSFVACSNASSSDSNAGAVTPNNGNTQNDGGGDVFEYAFSSDVTLETGYSYTENNLKDEAHYDGVMVKLGSLLDPAKMTKGTKCKFTLKGSVEKNFEYVNAKDSDKPQMTLQIVDNSAAAGWWTALSQKEIDLVETDGKIDLTWEFTLDKSAVTTDKSNLIIFLKVIENPTFSADNSMKVTVAATPTEEKKPTEETLLNEVWNKDWDTKTFEAAKFSKATNSTKIVFEVSKDTDRLVTEKDGKKNYSECYSLIQIIDRSDATGKKLSGGTAEGATVNGEQLEKMFQDADTNDKFYTVSYTPTAAEWENIKANGVGIQAHGVMFKSIKLDTPKAE